MQFATPARGDIFEPKVLGNALLIVTPEEVVTEVDTPYGVTDAIRCRVIVVDGPEAGKRLDSTLLFGRRLIGQLRSRIGQDVLGRLGQGVAKAGQSPPWELGDPTEADVEAATRAMMAAPAPVASDEEPF